MELGHGGGTMAKKVNPVLPKNFNKIAFVGDTPDKQDENRNLPFGGNIGQKIFQPLLKSCGINFEDCLVDNLVRYRPEGNKFYLFETKRPELVAQGIAEMKALIDEYNPNVIVPLGGVPLKYITDVTGNIGDHRGSIYTSSGFEREYKVIPTFHPSYLASHYNDTVISAFDMKRIAEESLTPDINLPDRRYLLTPTFEEACENLENVLKHDYAGFDIETQKDGHINCYGFATDPLYAFCIPILCESGDYWTEAEEKEIWRLTSKILYSDNVCKVIHNMMFEGFMMDYYYDMKIRNVYDTMIGSHVLYPELPNSLAFATSIFTKEPYYKEEGKGDRKTRQDWEQHYKYNCKDNAVTLEIMHEMSRLITADELQHIFDEEMQSGFVAVQMSLDGICVDEQFRSDKRDEVQSKQDEAKDKLIELVGYDINPGSYKQVQKLLYDEMGLPKKYKKNAKGQQVVATDADALGELGFKFGNPELELIINYRKHQMDKSFYSYNVDTIDGKLRCSHNPAGQVGSRWSTSKTLASKVGRNVQNFPGHSKGQIVPDKGKILLEIDLEQAESRFVALYANCTSQLQIFEDGRDIHAITAAYLFPEKTVEECGKGTVERYLGKTMDHSGNYGVGGLKLARKIYKETSKTMETPIKLEASVVQGYIDGYHELYPEIKAKYWEDIKAELRDKSAGGGYSRTLTNVFGRKRHFWSRLEDPNTLFEALNYKPQSAVAMIINKVINRTYLELYDEGVRPLIHTHDGCLFEIPEDGYMEFAKKIFSYYEIPIEIGEHNTIIPADPEIGDRWSKEDMQPLKFD